MKKSLGVLLTALAGTLLCPVVVLAGSINGAEQGIIDTISQSYAYEGGSYKVTEGYAAEVAKYLERDDVDMTQAEADDYIAQFHANLAVGIAAGYMERIGDAQDAQVSPDSSESEAGSVTEGAAAGEQGDNTKGSTTDGALEYTVLPVDEETMYVYGVASLDVHAEAYKDSDILGTLAEKDAVTVTGAASTGWAQIKYNDQEGYVTAVYLRTQGYMDELEKKEQAEEEPQTEETPKDYSDAPPVTKSFNLGAMALGIVIIFLLVIGGVVIYHRNKGRNQSRKS